MKADSLCLSIFWRSTFVCIFLFYQHTVVANENAKRLYDDLMINYNKLRRPVERPNQILTILLKLKLSQIIDVHEIDQTVETSVWLKQKWTDSKLIWDPNNYGGVKVIYVPAEMIWVPDIVLYNNAGDKYNISIMTKATLHCNGEVDWEPPAIFKSLCPINVQWFPFDEQKCMLKFGSWTFSEDLLDLHHLSDTVVYKLDHLGFNVSYVEEGIDLADYYPSVEWDIMAIPAVRNGRTYPSCCPEKAYIDITYEIHLRRKPLFYTVNLVFPCVGISFLTILVFYLPSDSGEKITLCISILVSLTVFFLLLTEIIPATSEVLPLIGKYLLFTMVMVTLSVIITVVALNLHFRKPTTHRMPNWVKSFFINWLPRYLFMRRPLSDHDDSFRRVSSRKQMKSNWPIAGIPGQDEIFGKLAINYHGTPGSEDPKRASLKRPAGGHQKAKVHKSGKEKERNKIEQLYYSPPVLKAFENVCFIAELLKKKDKDDKIDADWKFVAMVVDRLFLWIFSITCFLGTCLILLRAPTLHDTREPIDTKYRPSSETINKIFGSSAADKLPPQIFA